jgi:hypothetical protein
VTEAPRRRRRVRSAETAAAEMPDPVVELAETGASVFTAAVADDPAVWVAEVVEADSLPAERGLRGLVGGGSSQVSPTAALRARDAARPRAQDMARAETDLAIIRRNWSPRE